MDFNHDLPSRAMTREDALAVFQEISRHFGFVDEMPTFETSMDEWADTFLDEDIGTVQVLNHWFHLNWSRTRWNLLWYKAQRPTMGDVCTAIACDATLPVIEPWTIAGATCPAAGAFRTLCTLLRRRGVDIRGITPSTPLEPFLLKHGWDLVVEVSRIAPGRVPKLSYRDIQRDPAAERRGDVLAELVFALVAWMIPKLGMLVGVGSWAWRFFRWLATPYQPYFEGIATFRELCCRIVDLPAPVRPRLV